MLQDEVNRFILTHFNTSNPDLAKMIKAELDYDINSEAVRGRKRQLRKKFGDNLEHVNKFAEDLEAGGFEPHNWQHGWLKGKETSIYIRNKEDIVTYEDVRDEMVVALKKHAPKYPVIKRKRITDGHLLVIDPADLHLGKLAQDEETGNEYNIDIAKKRCIDGVRGIIAKSQGFNIDQIVFIVGNDVLHTDNPRRTTTSGTPQDTDKQWWYAYIHARDMYVQVIEELTAIADVHVIFCPSNHDYMSGFMLADSLACWFHRSKNVTFDVTMRHRKYWKYGTSMLEFDHGDGCKEADTPLIMASEQPKMWAESIFRYSFKHHIHHLKNIRWQSGKDYHGCTVQYLRTPSGTDRWHDNNGYTLVPKAIEGFIIHKEYGQISRLTHHFM